MQRLGHKNLTKQRYDKEGQNMIENLRLSTRFPILTEIIMMQVE